MGKAFQGVFGSFSGKVGNVVGRILQGEQVYAIYQKNVANPRTPEQVEHRTKFSLLVEQFKYLLQAVRLGFARLDGYRLGNPFSSAVGYNLRNGFGLNKSNLGWEVDFSTMYISEGTLTALGNPTATPEGADIIASWNNIEGQGDPLDDVYLVCYNSKPSSPANRFCLVSAEPSTRQSRTITMNCPTAWVGDAIEVWIFVRNKEGVTSNSKHLGSITL